MKLRFSFLLVLVFYISQGFVLNPINPEQKTRQEVRKEFKQNKKEIKSLLKQWKNDKTLNDNTPAPFRLSENQKWGIIFIVGGVLISSISIFGLGFIFGLIGIAAVLFGLYLLLFY